MRCLVCDFEYYDLETCPRCGQSNDTEPNRAWHLKPGTVIKNKYVLGKSVGSGGFGVTYFAWDKALNRQVAIKEYMPSEFATRAFGQRSISIYGGDKREQYDSGLKKYVDEARRLAQLNKIEGIAQIYDYFEENATGYIVMEYVPGITFSKYLEENGGKISYEKAITLMLPIMAALEEVHKHDIIHRDISPDNVLITPDEDVKLIDFGASRYATTAHSKSLSVILKPGYAPEEQYRSKGEQGPWSDVYAVGATLYRAITGIVPEDSMERKANDILKPIEKYRKLKVPQNISTAIMNALVSNHEYRYQNMAEFSDDLISDDKVAKIVAPKEAESGFHIPKKLRIALIAALFTSVAVAGFFIGRSFFREEEAIVLNSNYTATEINAPDLIGQTLSDAEQIAFANNIVILATSMQNSDSLPADSIMIQTPSAGTIIYTESTIELTVSKGPVKYNMPDVCFSYLTEATTVLKDLEFRVNTVEVSSDYAPGTVIEQEYEPNTLIERYEKVNLTVSTGILDLIVGEDTTVPNVVGKNFDNAKNICLEKGLYIVQIRQSWSDDIPKGQIISQAPSHNTNAQTGDVVEVEVSKGIEQVEVPDVRLECTEAEARTIMENSKLLVSVKYDSSNSVREGYVISQDVSPLTVVDKNTKITITISTGAPWSQYSASISNDILNNPEKYEVITKTQYAYSDYLWKEGDWTSWAQTQSTGDYAGSESRYHTKDYTWSAGDWTSWYSSPQSGDYCGSQTQYAYQTRSKTYTWSTSTSLSGWTATGSSRFSGSYTSWVEGDWTTSNYSNTSTREKIDTTTQYYYNRGLWYNTSVSRWYSTYSISFAEGKGGYGEYSGWMMSAWPKASVVDGKQSYSGTSSHSNPLWWNQSTRSVYKYRTRSEIAEYEYWQWGSWSSWSSWSDGSAPANTDTKQYKEQYRYQTKDYYWTDWGSWQSGTGPADTSIMKSETEYRYLEKEYYWSDYSDWTDTKITPNDTKQVMTRTVYSYRLIVD